MKKSLLFFMVAASMSAYAATPEIVTSSVEFNAPEAVQQNLTASESKESNPIVVENFITRGGTTVGDTTVSYTKKVPFYIGTSNKFYGYGTQTTYGIMPLYAESEFVNYSNENAGESYNWTTQYYSGGWKDEEAQTTKNMVFFPTSARQYKTPTLEMNGVSYNMVDLATSTSATKFNSEMACYKMSQFSSFKEDETKGYYGLAPFNFVECARRTATTAYGIYWSDIIMSNDSTCSSALKTLKKYYPNAEAGYLTATAQHIPAAQTGYSFDRFYQILSVEDSTSIAGGTVLTATIYKFIDGDKGFSLEKIGEAKSIVENTLPKGNNNQYYMANFEAVTVDPVTGLSSAGIVVPRGTEILISLDCKDNNYLGFFPLLYANNRNELDIYPVNLYYQIKGNNSEELWTSNPWTTATATPANMALWIDPEFDFLYPLIDDNTVVLPKAGGSEKVYVQSLYDYEDWYIEEDEDGEGKIDGWLSYEISQEEGKCPNVVFTADATETSRKATMTIESVAESVTLYINQGDAGVNSVAVEAVAVKTVGGNFEVVVPASVSNVAVYNVAGQKVADVNVTAGANTIDGSALANGVYVLKFNNGYTVKAVK